MAAHVITDNTLPDKDFKKVLAQCCPEQKVPGFRLVCEDWVPEIASFVRKWIFLKTGTCVVSLLNLDENKTFVAFLRTPPQDSSGAAHVLEHSVLAGSKNYPMESPIDYFANFSLCSWYGARTYPDSTEFSVASCHLQGYYNLVDIYLDAIFHPTLTADTFDREAYRIELGGTRDAQAQRKGVVLSEMKGLFTMTNFMIPRWSQQLLFPETCYSKECGGHPHDIPNLTREEVRRFHEKHYHPSTARLWFYGDDPEEMRLKKAAEFLQKFEKTSVSSTVELQHRWEKPREFFLPYGVSSEGNVEAKHAATVSWAFTEDPIDRLDTQEFHALSILHHILLATSSSPLRRALMESELGIDVVECFDTGVRQPTFTVGLLGLKKGSGKMMEQVVLNTLLDIEERGLRMEVIESSMNAWEFALREANAGKYPRGLHYARVARASWLHVEDPLLRLRYENDVKSLRRRIADNEPVFQSMVSKYFLKNPHRALVLFTPDPDYFERENALEAESVRKEVPSIVIPQVRSLARKGGQPKGAKAKSVSKFPALTINQLDRKIPTITMEQIKVKGVKVLLHPLFTNGIIYVDLFFDLSKLADEEFPLVSIFSRLLTELGTSKFDCRTLQLLTGRRSGGIRSSTWVSQVISPHGNGRMISFLVIRAKALTDQVKHVFQLILEILANTDLSDRSRVRRLLLAEQSRLEALLTMGRNGWSRLDAVYRRSGWAHDQLNGTGHLSALRAVISRINTDWNSILRDLNSLRDFVVSRQNLLVNLTSSGQDLEVASQCLGPFLDGLPERPRSEATAKGASQPLPKGQNEFLIVPSNVNCVGKAANLYDLGFKPSGSFAVVVRYLRGAFLVGRVREQGSAYGASCSLDKITGTFKCISHSDPNVKATLEVYDEADKFLKDAEISEEEITKNIMGEIRAMDPPMLPHDKGFLSAARFLRGETDRHRQAERDEVLGTSIEDFRTFASFLEKFKSSGTCVIYGGSNALRGALADGVSARIKKLL